MATAAASPFSHTSYFTEAAERWSITGFIRHFIEHTNTIPEEFDYIVDKYVKCLDDILKSGTRFSDAALQRAGYLKEKHKSDVRIFPLRKTFIVGRDR